MKDDSRSTTLRCFSPEVMLATFIIEIGLALYVLWRYKLRIAEQLIVILIICLASFQLAEYNICEGDPSRILGWTKFGFAAITLLPALGLHIASLVTKRPKYAWLAYGCATAMIATFLFIPQATTGAYCTGNYVILATHDWAGIAFGIYYWFFLCLMLAEAYRALRISKTKLSSPSRDILQWLSLGYLCFMVPMGVAYLVTPDVVHGTPSIMCGFALALAIILAFRVVPAFNKKKD